MWIGENEKFPLKASSYCELSNKAADIVSRGSGTDDTRL